MEANKEVDVSQWVDERMAQLSRDEQWEPNVERGLAHFRERCAMRYLRRWIWAGAAFAAACVCFLVWPSPREMARRILSGSHFRLADIGQVSASVKALKDGQVAPDFVLQDADGADVRLSAYKGKVVLLNFWATWCHGCTLEIPWLIEFEKKYKERGFAVVGVSMDADGWKAVKRFIAETKVNYRVVIGNDDMAKPYGLDAMPMTFLIDREGKIAATSVGIINKSACESRIVELLGPSPKSH